MWRWRTARCVYRRRGAVEQVREACDLVGDLKNAKVIATFSGSRLDRVTFAHPFLGAEILGVTCGLCDDRSRDGRGAYGSGAWADDFATGLRYELPLTCDVDAQGKLRNGLPEYDGLFVFKANAPIEALVRRRAR
jgi:isoleucyl-tRNA synthetase